MSLLLTIAYKVFPEIISGITFLIVQFIFPIFGYSITLFENTVLSLVIEMVLARARSQYTREIKPKNQSYLAK
jgi:hypothetical protein